VRSKGAAKSILGLAWENQVVVCVAWLGGLKRIDVLLQAIALLRPKRPSLRCLIVGGGPLADALLVQRDTLGLSNEVVFTGHHEDVRPFLEAGDVYVSTSEREGFGLALVEAMAFELPCVATNIGGHDEILSRPGTGVLVAPGDAEGVATQIEYLLDQPAESKAMGVAARGEVEARFNIDRMVAQLLDVLLGEK
jgi:glycosyltransferase involved in cell wall biosynthesis